MKKIENVGENIIHSDYIHFKMGSTTSHSSQNSVKKIDKKILDVKFFPKENWFEAIKDENIIDIEFFIRHKFDINVKDSNGDTALTWAMNNNKLKLIKLIIENGINIESFENSTCLDSIEYLNEVITCNHLMYSEKDDDTYLTSENWFIFINAGRINNIKFFIRHKFDIDVKDINGDTAFIIALREGYTTIVRLLLDAGADMNTSNTDLPPSYEDCKDEPSAPSNEDDIGEKNEDDEKNEPSAPSGEDDEKNEPNTPNW